MSARKDSLFEHLSDLPLKMQTAHGTKNVAELVLHDICCEDCFNLEKAAYLIDNPDFNCLKGIVGYSKDEKFSKDNVWDNKEEFSSHMKRCEFNQQVRSILNSSPYCKGLSIEECLQKLAIDLRFKDPIYFTWPMKHDNHGILIVEHLEPQNSEVSKHISKGAGLLSFCPVF